jgi:hypothetical protein
MISVPGDSRESSGTKSIFYVILRRKSQEKEGTREGGQNTWKKNARERKHQEETEKEKAKRTEQAKQTARGLIQRRNK